MKISRSKTAATAITLFLMFAMAVSLVALPAANAHDPAWKIPTFAFISVKPDPVGVGQQVIVLMWLDKTFDGTALTNDYRFHNYKLTITKPDGKTETMTWDVCQDPTSSQWTPYTPEQAGTYTFDFTFPGQDINTYSHRASSSYVNDTYLSSSASTTLTVQEEQIPAAITSYPLPTEYWTRPIYGENTDWWSISSNWLGVGSPVNSATGSGTIGGFGGASAIQRYPGDAVGSSTAHVMWTKPIQSGGVVGGDNFEIQGDTYYEGTAYNQRFTNPIIMNGRLYYNPPVSFRGTASGPTTCVDLRTGEVIWQRTDVPTPNFGYIYAVHDPNHHGVHPAFLVVTPRREPWEMYDADTGDWLFDITDVPSGTTVMGPLGEQLRYVMTNLGTSSSPDYRLAQWNMTKLFSFSSRSPTPDTSTTTTTTNVTTTTYVNGSLVTTLTPTTTTTTAVDASVFDSSSSHNRYDWDVSIPWRNGMSPSPTVIAAFYDNVMICRNGSLPTFSRQTPYTYFAVNLNASKGAVGSVLWWKTYNPAPGNVTITFGGADPTVGVFTEAYKETMQWVGYSMATGAKLWGPTASQTAFDYYGNPKYPYVCGQVAYGKLYSSAYGGIIYCYDLTTGDLLWTYGNGGEGNSTSSGFYTAMGVYPTFINAVGDGKIYTATTEHTVQTPIYKGASTRCINASNGAEIWTLSAYTSEFSYMSYAIADGYAIFLNCYDSQIYCVGKGPSATAVTASPKVSVHGGNVLVEGSVTDISAGTKQNEQAARFPNGVPAVSDEDMTDWMEYVYQQKPLPTDVTGVEVVLSVLDPNDNYYEVGRATSDASGFFSCMFTPEVPGKYTIIATFEGSEGYWPSYAETAINVEEAPAATPAPTPVPQAPVETYFTASTIAIIIAIAIVGFLILRKR
jgi:outer membrane protein assembly factor BamB